MTSTSILELKEVLCKSSINDTWSQVDEICPGVFLGGRKGAQNIDHLRKLGINHIINVDHQHNDIPSWLAQPKGLPKRHNANSYEKAGFHCKYLGIVAEDHNLYDISAHFEETTDFIETALSTEGKVLVHCYMGVSRSATVVIAFLMMKKNLSASEAVEFVRSKRCVIFPNDGFLEQICKLEMTLKTNKPTLDNGDAVSD